MRGSVLAILCGEILGREGKGWSPLGATAKLTLTYSRPQPLWHGDQQIPVRKQEGAVELWWLSGRLPLMGSAPGALLLWLQCFSIFLLLQCCLRELLGAAATWLVHPANSAIKRCLWQRPPWRRGLATEPGAGA